MKLLSTIGLVALFVASAHATDMVFTVDYLETRVGEVFGARDIKQVDVKQSETGHARLHTVKLNSDRVITRDEILEAWLILVPASELQRPSSPATSLPLDSSGRPLLVNGRRLNGNGTGGGVDFNKE